MRLFLLINVLGYFAIASSIERKKYLPIWDDLDSRPLPEWYDRAKIGIFLHWGVFSVPSFHSEWFWSYWSGNSSDVVKYMNSNYPPGFTYQEFAPMFKAEFFCPDSFADLFSKAGAKYVVLTSKHHEGYTLFPSKRSFSWNSVEVGPRRDLVGDLAKSVKAKGLKFGVYHSLYEWFNPIYLEDKANKFTTREYPENKLWPDIKQLVNDYKPSVLWSDGDWEAYDTYWNSTDLLAWLYNESPVRDEIVVNDRWGIGTPCKHGDFYNCADRYNPGNLQQHKWENAFTLDLSSWGFRRNMDFKDVMTMERMLKEVVSTVSCGGNALINVGPTKEGTIAPIFQERLLALGKWLDVNGEAIYSTSPWNYQNDTEKGDIWYTCRKQGYKKQRPIKKQGYNKQRTIRKITDSDVTNIYAIFLKWPCDNLLKLQFITPYLHSGTYEVKLLGVHEQLNWQITNGTTQVLLPDKAKVQSDYAWTLKFARF